MIDVLVSTDLQSQPQRSRRSHWNAYVERHATMRPDGVALRFEGRSTTWHDLGARIESLAGALIARGVVTGDRVGIVMGNRPEFIETMLAANLLGAVAVPLNFRLSSREADYVIRDSGSKVVVIDELGAPILDGSSIKKLDIINVAADPQNEANYERVLAAAVAPAHLPDVPETATALIMYTSGTTGNPKGAVLSYTNLQAQAQTLMRAFQYVDEAEVNLVASPLFHIGAIGSVAPSLLVGGTMVIAPTGAFSAAETLETLETERVTSVFLVPTQWQAICDHPDAATRQFQHLRVLGWGAAPASGSLLRRMASTFPKAMNVALFGQTEMSPVTCVLHGRDAIRKLGSVGRPVVSVAARVVDTDMRDVRPGEVGEIVYRGAGLMSGYWNKPEETAAAFHGGWFHSGDLVRVDDEGYIYVVDRAKDMIISGGENIYCAEVENVLAGHPAIAEVSVVGTPHPRWGETPVAVVTLRNAADGLTIEELRAWAADSLARFKLPTELVLVPQLPRNASGKVLKGTIRDQLPMK